MKKYALVINDETKQVSICDDSQIEHFKECGYTKQDVEESYNGLWYLKGYAPQETVAEKNENIRKQRQARYEVESDPLRMDYDEALAQNKIEALQSKINSLELAQATSGVVRYPSATTYTAGMSPFCNCGGLGVI